ncbi:MAG: coq7 [Gammaproteobacteria bacterium]|jgi:ubiquinone biosynthesis monooxygenase Coq7|nr:coq7 [Gammaproteobacteria bacterium]
MNTYRQYSLFDRLCFGIDQTLRTVCNNPKTTGRACPSLNEAEPLMTILERKNSAALMRVNHTGEVCAQALYHGQESSSGCDVVKEKMHQAAIEEGDHLAWCCLRIDELGGHASYLNLLWYLGSFGMGYVAGLMGDQWSLGFLAETETQVIQHLEKQLALLPRQDNKSYKILHQMRLDELDHRDEALKAGAPSLPGPVKKAMSILSKIMVKTAYWV